MIKSVIDVDGYWSVVLFVDVDYDKYDITDEVIEQIRENNDSSIIQSVIYNEQNVGKIINYFKEINIEVIDELLISRPELFTVDISKIKSEINKYNVEILVNLINEDINSINFI